MRANAYPQACIRPYLYTGPDVYKMCNILSIESPFTPGQNHTTTEGLGNDGIVPATNILVKP